MMDGVTSEQQAPVDRPAGGAMAPGPEMLELRVDGKPRRVVLRPGEVLLIGRDPACHVPVSDRSVSRRHAEITRVGDTWQLRDLGSRNGIHLNGERAETITVTDGAEIRIGSAHDGPVLAFSLPRQRSNAHAAAQDPRTEAGGAQADSDSESTAAPEADGTTAPADGPAGKPVPDGPAEEPATRVNRPPSGDPSGAAPGRPEIATFDASGRTRIGRSGDCDIVLADLLVSRRHAEVRQVGTEYQLIDLGSTNGTYLNGRRVTKAALRAGDLVSIGHFELTFDGSQLHERVDAGPISLTAERITVDIGKHRIVNDVSFSLEQGSLLGIIGPSGCGKSTLLRAVTGLAQASGGRVTYDGRDLYTDYAELRYRIGMVPQDDVLHRQLTVRRALRFAASLRFADDVTRQERTDRVEEVMQTLGLTRSAKQRIDRLSGGQRKRTSVALELLTEPSMLCLDEPTSGLDPALDRDVMRELRSLADRGRTILCVTHSVLHLDYCDRVLVLCPGGTTGYYGPPSKLLEFFEADDYADVFAKVTREPERWTQRYRESDLHRRYVAEPILTQLTAPPSSPHPSDPDVPAAPPGRSTGQPTTASPSPQPGPGLPTTASPASPSPQPGPGQSGTSQPETGQPAQSPNGDGAATGRPSIGGWQLPARIPVPAPIARALRLGRPSIRNRAKDPVAPIRQFVTLSLRMFAVIVADRGYFLFLLGLPMVLALLSHTVPGSTGLGHADGLTGDDRMEAMRILVVLIVGAAFIGISSAIREIVNEGTIYKRERAVGLSPGAYLAGKFVVLGIINVVQVSIFVWLSLLGRGAPDVALVLGSPMLEIIVPVAMVTTSATMLGLCISALARSVAQTTPVLVVVVMAMLVLSGGLFELSGQAVLDQISWLAPTRWGFAATASTVDLLAMVRPIFDDPLWTHGAGSWWRATLLLTVQIALLTAAARLAMRRLEPGRY